jgi:argininosuccinate lyase
MSTAESKIERARHALQKALITYAKESQMWARCDRDKFDHVEREVVGILGDAVDMLRARRARQDERQTASAS